MILGMTGHRPQKLGGFQIPNPIFNAICFETERMFKELNPDKIISGMALGFDSFAARIALKLHIPFVAMVPFEGQDSMWGNIEQQIYQNLLSNAEEVIIVSSGGYAPWKMQKRNEAIVDMSDEMLACFNGEKGGGTYNCVEYAKKLNKTIHYINPSEYSPA